MWRCIRISIVGLLLFFLLYKYIFLQLGLIKPNSGLLLALLGVLAAISFVLSGAETSITNIRDIDLLAWHTDISDTYTKIVDVLKNPLFDRIKVIRKVAEAIYSLTHFSRTNLFIEMQDTGPVVDIGGCVSMIVTCNAIINLNIAVLLPLCLLNSGVFLDGTRSLPLIGDALWSEPLLPLPGSAGFTSVGVTIVLLLAVELIPKKLALRNPNSFFAWSSFLVVLLKKVGCPRAFAETLDMFANCILYLCSLCWSLMRSLKVRFKPPK